MLPVRVTKCVEIKLLFAIFQRDDEIETEF